ncbi:MAG: ABC transporter ATP-binding protein [Lachnospiraceae bacterium]|nr:ABC transporter ATP-binding protein [Lachnospiraceae bacterium]
MSLVSLKDVHLSYISHSEGRAVEQEVLKGVSFEIGKGEIVGLAGESGSGKSTIARAILGTHRISSGELVRNTDMPQMIFQDPYGALNPAHTISWIMQEPLKMTTKLKGPERKERCARMLEDVGLDAGYLSRKPGELSGGQRQRICIGTALMREPELLIADEPVSALDVTVAAQVLALLKKLHDERKLAILFISHDLRIMYHFCQRIMILKDGVIVEQGTPDKLYRDPQHEYTKLLLTSAGIRS